jgi:hypothetical protein
VDAANPYDLALRKKCLSAFITRAVMSWMAHCAFGEIQFAAGICDRRRLTVVMSIPSNDLLAAGDRVEKAPDAAAIIAGIAGSSCILTPVTLRP